MCTDCVYLNECDRCDFVKLHKKYPVMENSVCRNYVPDHIDTLSGNYKKKQSE